MECTLCQFNPVRLCERNFGKKYLVSDALKAKCGASIKVEMVDALGQRVEKDLAGVQFEVGLPNRQLSKCNHIAALQQPSLPHSSTAAHASLHRAC